MQSSYDCAIPIFNTLAAILLQYILLKLSLHIQIPLDYFLFLSFRVRLNFSPIGVRFISGRIGEILRTVTRRSFSVDLCFLHSTCPNL